MEKTYRHIRERFYWKGMKQDIHDFVKRCEICEMQKLTRVKTKEPMVITDTPSEPFAKIAIDTVRPLLITTSGNQHILTMQCLQSKFCIALSIPKIKAITIANALARHFLAQYGVQRIILTDRGRSFQNKLLEELSRFFGFRLVTTTAHPPQSNGSLERSHALLADFIRNNASKSHWDRVILFAMQEYNTYVHSATRFTPYDVIYGRKARNSTKLVDEFPLQTYGSYVCDLVRNLINIRNVARGYIISAKHRIKEYYGRKARPQQLEVRMIVYVLKEPIKEKRSVL